MKYFSLLLIFLFLYSCGNEPKKIKSSPQFQHLYEKKLKELKNDPQFIIDKLELLYFKKGLNNNEANQLIKELPDKYKKIKSVFKLLFSNEMPKDITLDKKLLSLLLKFQENKNISKFIVENYYKAKDESATTSFFILYALDYNFTPEDYQNFLAVKELSDFIRLNFLIKKDDYCGNDSCSEDILDKEKFLNYINKEIYTENTTTAKNVSNLYKSTFKIIKNLKNDIKKINKRNKKLKKKQELIPEDKEELEKKEAELIFYTEKILPALKTYLYLHGNDRKLARNIDQSFLIEKLFINKTKINKKIFSFIFYLIKNKSFPIRLSFYKYLKDSSSDLSKLDLKRLESLRYTKGYELLKYGFYKKYYPELFKKLDVKSYLRSKFIHTVVHDFEWYFLENLRKDTTNIKNLFYFQYAPHLILPKKDELFNLYTKDKIGNYKISGNESLIYNFLKILLKSGVKLTEEQVKTLEPIKVIYIQEILKYFK
jgi:hypothetical protein